MIPVGFDLETVPFRIGMLAPPPICLADTDSGLTFAFSGGAANRLADLFSRNEILLVAHNASYDLACLISSWPDFTAPIFRALDTGRIHCTLMRERLLDIAEGTPPRPKGWYGLDRLMGRAKPAFRTGYGELAAIPIGDWTPEQRQYPFDDATDCLEWWHRQEDRAGALGFASFGAESARQVYASVALRLAECRGLRIDTERARAGAERAEKRRAELSILLRKAGLMRSDLSRADKTVRARVAALVPGCPRTPTGMAVANENTLLASGDPALAALAEDEGLQKELSTFWKPLAASPVLHPGYRTLGADTGRTSCGASEIEGARHGLNVQQLPRDGGHRECIRARDGFVFAVADYDSMELRTLAQILHDFVGDDSTAARYRADPNWDPHAAFASETLGISPDEGLRRKEAGDPEFKAARQAAKPVNFGLPGGLGKARLVNYARKNYGVIFSEERAGDLKRRWMAGRPGMREYFAMASDASDKGRQMLKGGRLRRPFAFTDAANAWFQGLAADIAKAALCDVSRRCFSDPDSALWGCRPVIFLHDEIVIEAPEAGAPEAAEELARIMTEAAIPWAPDVPFRASPLLMRRWSKKAKEIRDAGGRLMIWEGP